MTNTMNATWAYPTDYNPEQIQQPAPAELPVGDRIELDPTADASSEEVANALYWSRINNTAEQEPVMEAAYVANARADVHHAIDAPEARSAAAAETNARFVDAAIHRAKAYTASTMTMRSGAVDSLNTEAMQNNA